MARALFAASTLIPVRAAPAAGVEYRIPAIKQLLTRDTGGVFHAAAP